LGNYTRFQQHPAKIQKNDPRFFQKNDYIQINLKTGLIGWFSEGLEQRLLNEIASQFSPSTMKGEIAIMANVTEEALAPGGVGADGNLEGRVVFYSGDIYSRQALNEFNIPIFGPYKYKGGSLTIDLWVLELDRAESDQMGAVLETLTDLSSEAPALGLPGVDILSQIGTSFLKSNKDDVIGHIRVTLAPPRPGEMVMDPILQVSDVVVSRSDDRSEGRNFFANCEYHPGSGRVTSASDKDQPCQGASGRAGDNNIFVLGVRRAHEGPDISSALTLSQLTDRLAKANKKADLSKAIDLIGDEARSASAYSASLEALERLQGDPSAAVQDISADFILREMQCTVLAARYDGKPVQKEVCGERATQRAMSMDDFSRLSKKIVEGTCISPDSFSVEALIGAATDQTVVDAQRKALRKEMKVKPKEEC
jgi:hypothetical protein